MRVPREQRHRRQIVLVGQDARVASDFLAALGDRDEVIRRGRDDHEMRPGDVLELLTAGRAWPGIGADREPVAVLGVLAGVLGDLLVVPDDLLDGEQNGAVIHMRKDIRCLSVAVHGADDLDCGHGASGSGSRAAPARWACRASLRGRLRRSALLRELSASAVPEPLEEVELVDAAAQVSAWCGEPLLYDGDDPAMTLAPGTARRRALDAAREEIAGGLKEPSSGWRFRFSLMLGLERVLAADPPALANGLTLRPHQVDALAGMLAALTSSEEREADADDAEAESDEYELNGETPPAELEAQEDEDWDDEEADGGAGRRGRLRRRGRRGRRGLRGGGGRPDPGAIRRYRFKHPTASGKTVAAAGFVEACRTVGVLILTHRRLLVDQFMRDLKEQGYGPRLIAAIEKGKRLPRQPPVTIETYAWFIKHAADIHPDAYGVVICDEAHTALGERTAATIRRFSRPIYIGMTATDQLLQKHVGDVFPAEVADFPLADAVRRGVVAPLRALRVKPGASLRNVPVVGRRLRSARAGGGTRPRGAQHGRCDALSRSLRPPCGHRLRGGRGSRRARGCSDARCRPARPLRQRPHAAARARCDACRLRARRHQRACQRPAAGGGLERAARHDLHAPGSDRQPSRLPAAHRPRHAAASSQGSRRRRRLRRSRRRRTPSARSRCTACSTWISTSRVRSSPRSRRAGDSAGGARRGRCCGTPNG